MLVSRRTLATKTPVYDHADAVLYHASRERASELIASRRVEVIGNRRRIDALRVLGPDPALLPGERGRKAQTGSVHRHENYWNPRGVWTIDPVPPSLAREYVCVLAKGG